MKVIRCYFASSEYTVFLNDRGQVDTVIVFPERSSIGTEITWPATPWQVKDFVERQLDPHVL